MTRGHKNKKENAKEILKKMDITDEDRKNFQKIAEETVEALKKSTKTTK